MSFFEFFCLNGQFEYDISAGINAANLPFQACAGFFENLRSRLKTPEISYAYHRKTRLAGDKLSR